MGIKEVIVGIVAVFDGHNGAEASEMASKLLVEYFVLHTYFILDATYSILSKTSSGRLPYNRDCDEAKQLHRWEEIVGWHELHFGRYLYICSKFAVIIIIAINININNFISRLTFLVAK